jgi:hypothetical protein
MNLRDYLEKQDFQVIRQNLAKKSFESIRSWIDKLSEIEFETDDKPKIELIITLINKFISIQTLDEYGVIDFLWLETGLDQADTRRRKKGHLSCRQRIL